MSWVTVCRPCDTERRFPLVDICATWRADQVLYGSCTLGTYSDDIVFTHKILALGGKARSRNSVQYRPLYVAVSA